MVLGVSASEFRCCCRCCFFPDRVGCGSSAASCRVGFDDVEFSVEVATPDRKDDERIDGRTVILGVVTGGVEETESEGSAVSRSSCLAGMASRCLSSMTTNGRPYVAMVDGGRVRNLQDMGRVDLCLENRILSAND